MSKRRESRWHRLLGGARRFLGQPASPRYHGRRLDAAARRIGVNLPDDLRRLYETKIGPEFRDLCSEGGVLEFLRLDDIERWDGKGLVERGDLPEGYETARIAWAG